VCSSDLKIRALSAMIASAGLSDSVNIEVDGGIGPSTIAGAAAAGANILIAGTALWRYEEGLGFAVQDLRERAEAARR
jgi:ribulose-phosphate 3-epimerase